MKVTVCLLWLVSIISTHSIVPRAPSIVTFDLLKQGFDITIGHLKSAIRESVLSEDGLSLQEEVNLRVLEALCDPEETVLVGESCRKEFSKLEDCAATPCKILDWVKNQAPEFLSKFVETNTYEEIYSIVFGEGIVPLWRMLCECRGVVAASINCVRNYDGILFEVSDGANRTEFDRVVSKLDWEALKTVVLGVLKSGCREVDGADCLVEMTGLQAAIGRVLDRTFRGEEGCLSLRRAEEDILRVFLSLVHETVAENVKAYIEACVELWDTLMCDEGCAGEMQDTFYSSCCIKRAAELINSTKMRTSFTRLFRSVWSILYEGSLPTGVVDQYLSMFEPATFCADKTQVYRDFNEHCEAIGA